MNSATIYRMLESLDTFCYFIQFNNRRNNIGTEIIHFLKTFFSGEIIKKAVSLFFQPHLVLFELHVVKNGDACMCSYNDCNDDDDDDNDWP